VSKLEKKLKLWNRFLEKEGHEFIGGVLEVAKHTGGRFMGLIQWIHTEEEHLVFTVSTLSFQVIDGEKWSKVEPDSFRFHHSELPPKIEKVMHSIRFQAKVGAISLNRSTHPLAAVVRRGL
jgi:hypothetical protein